jgi:hypothetical protein
MIWCERELFDVDRIQVFQVDAVIVSVAAPQIIFGDTDDLPVFENYLQGSGPVFWRHVVQVDLFSVILVGEGPSLGVIGDCV